MFRTLPCPCVLNTPIHSLKSEGSLLKMVDWVYFEKRFDDGKTYKVS